ncbi:MAG: ChaN family lipoprotein [Desulfobulbaceae bacterium]|nr:ChaN family lipoprotein [Desulfobulbaceae bacterium]
MPKKPSPHSPNGRLHRLADHSIRPFVLVVALLLSVNVRAAQTDVIDYQLAVGFDLSKQMVHGTARLAVPAGKSLRLDLHGFEVTMLQENGTVLGVPSDSIVRIPEAAVSQHVIVHYQKSFVGSADNLVGPAGIALTGFWHPQTDSDCRFHLQASLPNEFEAVSEADQIDTEVTAGGKTQRFSLAQPLPYLTFVAGPYVVVKEPFANGKTLYSYFFAEDAELAADYRQKALGYLKRYEELIGPYPYQRFSIVENRLPTGYAMAGYTLLGQSVARLPFITETSLGHEILHSWFGNSVRVDQTQGNWCEGLTTYLADQAYAADEGEGAAFRKESLLKYQHYVKTNTALAVKDFHGAAPGQDQAQQAVRAVGYGKVAMIFRMLEQKLGHEVFISSLRHFYLDRKGKTASWDDLRQSFEQNSVALTPALGKEWAKLFFNQWLQRQDIPNLSAEKISLAEKGGVLTLAFTLHQSGDKPYAMDVPILIFSSTGLTRKIVRTETIDQEVVLPLTQHPTAMVLDPDYDLMRVLTTAELSPSWDWFTGSEKKLVVVNSTSEYDLYQPLIELLEAQGAEITAANEVTDAELVANAVIFLGVSGPTPRSLFANPQFPAKGVTFDIRKNPFNQAMPVVLVSAENQTELQAGLVKMKHYGKYGYLHFENGRALAKKIIPAALGVTYELDEEPVAIVTAANVSLSGIMAKLAANRVIYVGESHTRFEDHKLQLRVIRELLNMGKRFAIGMEMFPHDTQKILDAFIGGDIEEAEFLKKSKYFSGWRFDYRLYRDIINFARQQKIPIIALNIDKESVSKVYAQGGMAGLSPEETASLPVDRDLDVPGYRERIHSVYAQHPGRDEKQFAGFFQAQAIWDEVMAQTVVDYLVSHPDQQMVVLAGLGHVVKENAIPPRVARRLDVEQAVLMSSDGTAIAPSEADYVVFMPPSSLPQAALLGIVMNQPKEKEPVVIEEVVASSPAAKAGLKNGDSVLSVDGKPVAGAEDIKIILLDKKIGETVTVRIKRQRPIFADQELTFDVTL